MTHPPSKRLQLLIESPSTREGCLGHVTVFKHGNLLSISSAHHLHLVYISSATSQYDAHTVIAYIPPPLSSPSPPCRRRLRLGHARGWEERQADTAACRTETSSVRLYPQRRSVPPRRINSERKYTACARAQTQQIERKHVCHESRLRFEEKVEV